MSGYSLTDVVLWTVGILTVTSIAHVIYEKWRKWRGKK
jgi:hypothetical protein